MEDKYHLITGILIKVVGRPLAALPRIYMLVDFTAERTTTTTASVQKVKVKSLRFTVLSS